MASWEVILADIGSSITDIWAVSWWVLLPLGLLFLWQDFWVWGMHRLWRLRVEFVLLEIRVPRNIEKSPKAMENVFAALHAVYIKPVGGFEDDYFKGEELYWFTCELVGYAGGVHFFIRCPKWFRNLVESAVYSEYPDAEIVEAEDYTELMPDVLPNDTYDLWGEDYVLAKDSAYPLRSYEFFEAPAPEKRLDPIAAITEVMSRLREGEAIWLQFLIRPIADHWKKEGEEIRDKIMERKKVEKKGLIEGWIDGLMQFIKNLSLAAIEQPSWVDLEKKEESSLKFVNLSPGEREVLEGVERKIAKLGFEGALRFIYIDRRDSYTPANVAAVKGALRQFNTQDMNSLAVYRPTQTFVTTKKLTYKGWFRQRRIFYRKRQIFEIYKVRWMPPKVSIFNTEELATMFHFPLLTVEAPLLRRLETRKGEPPANLPT